MGIEGNEDQSEGEWTVMASTRHDLTQTGLSRGEAHARSAWGATNPKRRRHVNVGHYW